MEMQSQNDCLTCIRGSLDAEAIGSLVKRFAASMADYMVRFTSLYTQLHSINLIVI